MTTFLIPQINEKSTQKRKYIKINSLFYENENLFKNEIKLRIRITTFFCNSKINGKINFNLSKAVLFIYKRISFYYAF